ncbi:bestrophin family ion channel [Variovorax sp. J22P271]|uniref:bestrophin family protein n=1 Tax=Variovorax davisae TaxID=3053515 RepID=UPI002577A707|nr:bestrophin family ion channel [Variovorax sp. J22P271]MDM0036880.1 bestrophin family ion channel [Variovorax sp. J22P271]
MIVLQRPHGIRLFFVLTGSVIRRIAPAVATCTALAIAVTLSRGYLFDWKVTLTAVPFSIIGLALSIFLGFRNSAAFDRYWEARKLWGELIHRSRTLARQAQSFIADPDPLAQRDACSDVRVMLVRHSIAFAHALRHQLRGSAPQTEIAPFLGVAEAAAFAKARNGTAYLLRRMGEDLGAAVRAGRIDPRLAAQLDETLSGMTAVAAGCERIRSTPIPFVYTLLLHRTATLFCFLLPFGLVDLTGYMTPVVVAFVAYTFFGLAAVGDEIEEPFGTEAHHLPLHALCRTIEIDALEALGESRLPPPLEPVDARLS